MLSLACALQILSVKENNNNNNNTNNSKTSIVFPRTSCEDGLVVALEGEVERAAI